MELRKYAALTWRWLWLIVLAAVIAGTTAFLVSRGMAPVYQASTTLLVNQSQQPMTDYTSILTSERLSRTYAEWLRATPVLTGVLERLGLPAAPDDLEKLGKAVVVQYLRDTQLLVVTVEDTDPVRAASIANTIPEVFGQQSQELQTRRFSESKAAFEGQLKVLQAEIERTQAAITQLGQTQDADTAERARLQADLRDLQTNYTILFNSLGTIRMEEARNSDTVYAIQRAEPPQKPIQPRPLRNALQAAFFGVILALSSALLIEYLDDVLKDPDEVKAALGLSVLGAVPVAVGDGADKPAMLASGQSPVTEAYRVLRTNLQFAAVDRPLRFLQVSSPSPSEGKSVTSANLAVTLAQGGKRVILVDCDLHRPRVHHLMALPNNIGLTSALIDQGLDPLVALRETPAPGLQVLTSGPIPPNPAEILGSARMHEVLAALGAAADIVILDSPPVLAMSDAVILAAQVDGVLLVVDARATRREPARRAMASLQQVKARVVGVVLNRVSRERSGYYYYYYSHYNEPGDGSRPRGRRWPWQKGEKRGRKSEPDALPESQPGE